ncbi:MAG: hypothetical protein ACHQ50_08155 [Fimbriimonadales bacterium]
MKLGRLSGLLALASFLLVGHVGETLRLGRIELTVPDGWSGRIDGDHIVLSLQDAPSGATAEITIEKDMKSESGIRQWFYDLWADALKDKSVSKKELPSFSQTNTSQSFIAYAELSDGSRLVAAATQTDRARLLGWYRCSSGDLAVKGRSLLPDLLKAVRISDAPGQPTGPAKPDTGVSKPPTTGGPGQTQPGNKPGDTKTKLSSDVISGAFEPDDLDVSALVRNVRGAPAGDSKPLIALARAIGFNIVDETGKVISPSETRGALKFPVTEEELIESTDLARRGDRIGMASVCRALDFAHKKLGITEPCADAIAQRFRAMFGSPKAADRRYTQALVEMAPTGADSLLNFSAQNDVRLDPLQFLFIIRRASIEYAYVARRMAGKRAENAPGETSHGPSAAQEQAGGFELPEWAEGAVSLDIGVAADFGIDKALEPTIERLTEHGDLGGLSQIENGKNGLAAANALLSILKFYLTYHCLQSSFEIVGGPPLKRTPSHRTNGETKTVKGKFWIDAGKLDAFKLQHRLLLAANKIDMDFPKSGPLKEKTVTWDMVGSKAGDDDPPVGWHSGEDAEFGKGFQPQHTVTNGEGEADAKLIGLKQKQELRTDAVPWDREVTVRASVRVKSNEPMQDVVDIGGGALGILGLDFIKGKEANPGAGPIGAVITQICELLYRIDWEVAGSVKVPIEDWTDPGKWIITVTCEVKGEGSYQVNNEGIYSKTRKWSVQHTYTARCKLQGTEENPDLKKMMEDPNYANNLPEQARENYLKLREQYLKTAGQTNMRFLEPHEQDVVVNDDETTRGWDGDCLGVTPTESFARLRHPYGKPLPQHILKGLIVVLDNKKMRVRLAIPNAQINCLGTTDVNGRETSGEVVQSLFPVAIDNPVAKEDDELMRYQQFVFEGPLSKQFLPLSAAKGKYKYKLQGSDTRKGFLEFDSATSVGHGRIRQPVTYKISWELQYR